MAYFSAQMLRKGLHEYSYNAGSFGNSTDQKAMSTAIWPFPLFTAMA